MTNQYTKVVAVVAAVALALCLLALVAVRPAGAAFTGSNGKIAFASDRVTPDNPTGDFEIFSSNPDGTGVRQLTFNTTADFNPSYSPDGTSIAYEDYDGSDFEVFTIPASGGARTQVTNNAGRPDGPDWQPNTAPTATGLRPAPGSTTRDRTPTISAKVADTQDDLTKASTRLNLDGNKKTFSYNSATDKLTFTADRLAFGKHTAEVVAKDASGPTTSEQWSFKVVR